ncbi:PLP-dependent transferase [Cylindrobasidium torrendii FP15055 ss-10]|uniref:alanine--glyoxylate transaminase n=1 Tax=Cylindrobasidium torrendii FP15055 ss-10 TaxID=1314674 RepID=A0A0D7BKN0_9AGAR|nr:PLP-dependent transferase [Cylindrobasidium torrendii FP15055 ss-10]
MSRLSFLRPASISSRLRNLSSSKRNFAMSSIEQFKQAPHKLLVIPGPIEVDDEVLYANAHPSMSHVSPDFVPVFGDCIRMTREVLQTEVGQPFLISGSGTLGWDQPQVAANLVEPGENALVLHSGYFADSFTECLETYGAKVDQVKAPIGEAVTSDALEEALKSKKYKVVTVTHVDTSTAVLSDIKSVAATVRRVSPETLVIVDGVCSVASEEIRFDDWDIDVVLTASQKGLGTPPGLSILVASPRAIKTFETRSVPVTSYYGSWKKWLPIMKAYESGSGAYFATPPVNLIYAFHASLKQITKSSPSLAERFALHKEVSQKVKDLAAELGIKQLPLDPAFAANGMTALYFPGSITAADVVGPLGQKGIVVAGGLHKDIKDKYFRIGHMGVTVVDKKRSDIDTLLSALREVLTKAVQK